MSARTGEKLVIRLENAITAGENRLYPSAEAYRADLRDIAAQIAEHDKRQREEIQRLHRELESAGAITPDELAERYMELPVDADGMPIHVGDKMEYIAIDPFVVCAVAPGVIHAWAETKLGEGKTTVDYPPVQCHHFKPRTIEDVLHEFAKRVLNSGHQWGLDAEETTANYADEIRELMGGRE